MSATEPRIALLGMHLEANAFAPVTTEADFRATLALVEEVRYAQAYSFRYSPRPGTPAADSPDQVPEPVQAERLARLQARLTAQQQAFNAAMRGRRIPVRFDKPGLVAIGCNIHDSMQAFIQVVDTPFARKTDQAGRVTLRGVPADLRRVRVWHPLLRAPGNQLLLTVDGSRDATVPVSLKLRRPAPSHHDY